MPNKAEIKYPFPVDAEKTKKDLLGRLARLWGDTYAGWVERLLPDDSFIYIDVFHSNMLHDPKRDRLNFSLISESGQGKLVIWTSNSSNFEGNPWAGTATTVYLERGFEFNVSQIRKDPPVARLTLFSSPDEDFLNAYGFSRGNCTQCNKYSYPYASWHATVLTLASQKDQVTLNLVAKPEGIEAHSNQLLAQQLLESLEVHPQEGGLLKITAGEPVWTERFSIIVPNPSKMLYSGEYY